MPCRVCKTPRSCRVGENRSLKPVDAQATRHVPTATNHITADAQIVVENIPAPNWTVKRELDRSVPIVVRIRKFTDDHDRDPYRFFSLGSERKGTRYHVSPEGRYPKDL